MTRDEIIQALAREAPALKAKGIRHAALFGSRARGHETTHSDVDIVIDVDPEASLSGYDLMAIKHHLEDALGLSVDLLRHPIRRPKLRAEIEQDQIRVF